MAQFTLTTYLDLPLEQAAALVEQPSTLFYVARPLVFFRPVKGQDLPSRWQEGTYWFRLYLWGIIPIGQQAVVISYPDGENFSLLDDGHSWLIKQWRHLIRLTPEGQGCCYQDILEIEAGLLTSLVAGFARLFYRHRQRRWLKLAEQFRP
ncbi:hypothetical protein STRDD11_01919 [Streptococcus sp. DD11]|uniref:hypothetical protein n=1 Tax=Streptococcus sp. DD11 TaxID=1777879 RepID=UPI000795E194|nr:hypothetical protein [Streptococcus sp. DD11]KXT82184.1 hypothetical protein STRDD11_01919 [Streptococcus sp. DD11]